MSDYTLEELEAFQEQVNERIASVEAQLAELEDVMNSGDDQIHLHDRWEKLVEKGIAIQEAINAIKDREFEEADLELDDYDD